MLKASFEIKWLTLHVSAISCMVIKATVTLITNLNELGKHNLFFI